MTAICAPHLECVRELAAWTRRIPECSAKRLRMEGWRAARARERTNRHPNNPLTRTGLLMEAPTRSRRPDLWR